MPNVKVHYNSGDKKNKERKVKGKYYNKFVDITVCSNDKEVLCLGFKFPCATYEKNSVNYFEQMTGETVNIQKNNIPYIHIYVLPSIIPLRNNDKEVVSIDKINEDNMKKYIELMNDIGPDVPEYLLFLLVDLDDDFQNLLDYSDPKNIFISDDPEHKNFHETFSKTFTWDKFCGKLENIKSNYVNKVNDNG